MAFASETVTAAKHGLGPIIWKMGSTPAVVARVVSFSIEAGDGTLHEIKGGSPDQIVDLFRAAKATGKIQITTDEVLDVLDTSIIGKQANVTLEQEFPLGTTAGWKMTAATAYVQAGTISGARDGTTDTTTTYTITPYAAVGTEPWAFTDAQSYA